MNKQKLIEELNQTTVEFLQTLDSFPADQINIVPFEGSWTAGQVAEHILISEGGLPEMLMAETAVTERPVDERVALLESIFLDFSTKLKAPDFNVPSNGPHEKEKLMADFRHVRKQLEHVAQTADLTLTCTTFPFPTIGELTRWEWINFVICHAKRHIHQLRNILAKLTEKVEG